MVEALYERLREGLGGAGRELKPRLRRLLRLLALPWYHATQIDWLECRVSRRRAAGDLLHIFFALRYYPDNYMACRLWERPRREWALFYGSGYNPWPRHRLQREVQRPAYEVLFEDKEVAVLLCRSAGLPQPAVLGALDPGPDLAARLAKLMDARPDSDVVLKPVHGSAGRGIVRVERRDGGLTARTGRGEAPLSDLPFRDRVLVQEALAPAPELAELAPGALSTIRVVTLMTRAGRVLVLGASMRFGVGESIVDNWSAGGIAVGIDTAAGRLLEVGYDKRGRRHRRHPDTGRAFAGSPVPRWADVVDLAERTQRAFPFFRLFGVDVAVGWDGPCIIEINALPDLVFQEQTSGPLLARPEVLRAFAEYDLLINPAQRRLARESAVTRERDSGP